MQLNHDKTEVYCHACLAWHRVNLCLWLTRDDGVIQICCPEHEEVVLGYDTDLDEV